MANLPYVKISHEVQHIKADAWCSSPRVRTAHKGDFGHVLVCGGQLGMGGAALLAARAALRIGAGRVSVATHPGYAALWSGIQPELMCHGVERAADLATLVARASVVAVGPGLGQGAWGLALWARLMEVKQPLVVDADALNFLAQNALQRDDWILTPHPGEAARLLKTSVQAVQQDRFGAVIALQEAYGGVCILKGAGSLVCGPDKIVYVCDAGNPGMASAGMGDVLTGVVAGLLAQRWQNGARLEEIATQAVWLHATAGDKAARDGGERGLVAGDLLPWLREGANGR
ncbi:MAG: NAD(P)H-hydrate dehydratase [Pseudomonadota bacterium]